MLNVELTLASKDNDATASVNILYNTTHDLVCVPNSYGQPGTLIGLTTKITRFRLDVKIYVYYILILHI